MKVSVEVGELQKKIKTLYELNADLQAQTHSFDAALTEKDALILEYRDGQRELHCVFVDLEKVYDRVPREELWYCMRKSGVAEKYVRVVQDMYERSRTVVRCAVGQTEEFKVEVGLHQGSALSPFLFAIVMDQLSEEVRQESPWTMMFADDIVICSESREQVEENLERWRFALERRGMKVSRSKTEYMCVNEREGSGTVRLQGEEVKKVQEFKYLGSTVQSNGECGKEKTRHIEELKAAVMEYSSVTELLRAEKSKLESQMQLLLPDMAIPGLSLSVAYRLNQTSSGSLETELALAQQNPPEGAELFSSMCLASPLDETLDREVLLLLQGPTPEQMSVEFKLLINKLKQEFEEDTLEVLAALPGFIKNQEVQDTSTDPTLQGLRVQLEQRRSDWTHGLEQLKQYTDSLEKELLKMASNMRRSRTEILHLSVRLQEQENHKLLLREELDQLKTQQDHRDAGTQTDPPEVVDDEENSSPEWDRVYPLLDSPSEEESAEFETNTQEDDEKQPDDDADEMEELLEDLSKLQCLQETCCGEDGKQDVITPEYEAGPPEAGPPEGSPPDESSKGCPGSPTRIIMDIISDTPLYKNRLEDHAEPQQEEARFPACSGPDDTHEQAACCSASLSHSYPQHADEVTPLLSELPPPNSSDLVSAPAAAPSLGQPFSLSGSAPEEDPGPEGEQDVSDSMSSAQKLTQDQISAVPTVLERSGLLPVAEEEEPMTEASQQGAAAVNSKVVSGATGTSAVKDNGASVSQTIRSRIKKDLETPSSSMETIGEQRSQEDSDTPDKNGVIPEDGETMREDGLTQSEKDIESEFLRLSLSHRCDMFTLEKRLRLEERSRNLAEENVRKEVSSCQGLLQSGAESPGFVRAGSRGQQSKQGCPDLTLPTHFLQLFWRDPEAFPGQPRDIVSPACPGSSPGSLPGGACPEHLPRETSWRHPKQMPEPPQLSFFDVEEQRLYSELLLGDRAPYPISKRAPCHPTEEAHFGRMYPGSYPFGHDPELMTIGITVVAHMGFEVPQQNYGVPSRSTFQHPSQGLQKGWVLHTAVRPISRNNSETPIPGPKAQGNNPLVYRGKLQHMASELGGYKQAQPSSMPLTMGHSREEEGPTSLKELGSRAQAALIPLCGDDNPSLEIIQRLQKNLDILLQSVTRVASRSEMLGSIHQVGCELEEKERFWSELDEVMESIPTGERVVIGADFNGHVGEGNTGDEEVMGKFGVKERNLEGQMDSIQRKRLAKKKWDMDRTEENRQEYKELQRRVKREVSKAKQKAYDELYTRYKYRDGQRKLHCVFVDLEKAYDRVPREELWYCMRKSGVVEKYVRVVQDMYERSRTVVRCVVGQTEEFNVEVGLHQGSALSPFLFAIVMDQLSEEVRQESLWTMMFADDIVICSESREQVEENLERWRFALERRGMKASRSKTEYMCVNEREGSGTVRLQGEKVKKVQEFKYLGSTVQSNGESGKEETRMGKAIEVMIQHVENLRRTYTKEHTELLELRENHLQKERSFISHTDRDELRKRKVSAEFYKHDAAEYSILIGQKVSYIIISIVTAGSQGFVAARRVSIAAIPRSTGASTPTDMTKDAMEMEKLGHQSPSDPSPMPTNIPSPSTEMASPFGMKAAPPELPEVPKGVCTWAALMVVLAAFVAVLGKMLIQPAADAAPVGTGDSWMAIQQILWPYTGLRHNGQPPV
ncbi:hypothetical protein QTP86_032702 [Hemibagrus guttatus]|nr:hypothetical protein QTP86_032702 [Hemibagrus guttatus]